MTPRGDGRARRTSPRGRGVSGEAHWTVSAVTRLEITGAVMPVGVSDEQRIDTQALVSMSFDRAATGALRGFHCHSSCCSSFSSMAGH